MLNFPIHFCFMQYTLSIYSKFKFHDIKIYDT